MVQSKFNHRTEGDYCLGLRALEKAFAEEVLFDLALNCGIDCYIVANAEARKLCFCSGNRLPRPSG